MSEVDDRWILIGGLVEKHGNKAEKEAWMLCRADAAEWRMENTTQPDPKRP